MDKSDGNKGKVEKYVGAFCVGYAAGRGAATGWKDGLSHNRNPYSYNNH